MIFPYLYIVGITASEPFFSLKVPVVCKGVFFKRNQHPIINYPIILGNRNGCLYNVHHNDTVHVVGHYLKYTQFKIGKPFRQFYLFNICNHSKIGPLTSRAGVNPAYKFTKTPANNHILLTCKTFCLFYFFNNVFSLYINVAND